jgi:hypothetical protein
MGLHIRTFVAGLAIATVLVLLTPMGPSALADEIGPNDFRISDMGPDGDVNFAASILSSWDEPAVAYNSTADEYLVVWDGDDRSGALDNDEFEVYGQRLDASTGAKVGANDFRIQQHRGADPGRRLRDAQASEQGGHTIS